MNLGEGFSLTRGLHNSTGAVAAEDTGNMFNFSLNGWKHCGIKNFWKVKEKAIEQLLQNHLAAQKPAYTGVFAQLFSLKMKLKDSKVGKKKTTKQPNNIRGELRVSKGSFLNIANDKVLNLFREQQTLPLASILQLKHPMPSKL